MLKRIREITTSTKVVKKSKDVLKFITFLNEHLEPTDLGTKKHNFSDDQNGLDVKPTLQKSTSAVEIPLKRNYASHAKSQKTSFLNPNLKRDKNEIKHNFGTRNRLQTSKSAIGSKFSIKFNSKQVRQNISKLGQKVSFQLLIF